MCCVSEQYLYKLIRLAKGASGLSAGAIIRVTGRVCENRVSLAAIDTGTSIFINPGRAVRTLDPLKGVSIQLVWCFGSAV